MNSLNLGLDVLLNKSTSDNSFDLIESMAQSHEAYLVVQRCMHEGTALFEAYDSLLAIGSIIHKYGVTPAIEAIVGDSFGGEVSMEAAAGSAKAWYVRVLDWMKKMVKSMTAWWKKVEVDNEGWRDLCQSAIVAINEGKFEAVTDDLIYGNKLKEYLIPTNSGKLFSTEKWTFVDHEPEEVKADATGVKNALTLIMAQLNTATKYQNDANKFFSDWQKKLEKSNAAGTLTSEQFQIQNKERDDMLSVGNKNIKELQERVTSQASIYCKLVKIDVKKSEDEEATKEEKKEVTKKVKDKKPTQPKKKKTI